MPNQEAVRRLQARANQEGLAGVLVFNPVNIRYLVGYHSNAYSRPLTLVVPAEGEPTSIVPYLEDWHAHDLTSVADIRSYIEWADGSRTGGTQEGEWLALLSEVLRERGLAGQRVGVERSFLSATREPGLRAKLDTIEWVDASGWVEVLRRLKTPAEVANHRRAGQLAGIGLDAGFAAARAGRSELEIRGAAMQAMLTAGAEQFAQHSVTVGGNALIGPRIATVHIPASPTRARAGDFVFVVMAVSVDGSSAELSRTIVVGAEPTAEQRRLYEAVEAAHEAARAVARPGTPAVDLDGAARQALARYGLVQALTMRSGHGIGFAGSEPPNLGAADTTPLEAGMVISIEPGVCLRGVGGVLWADNYLVGETGLDRLTDYPVGPA